MEKPFVHQETLPGGACLLRFGALHDLFWYDEVENNPHGLGFNRCSDLDSEIKQYKEFRHILTSSKIDLIAKTEKALSIDPEFLQLVYKGKSQKRKFELNKFVGNLSMTQYATGAEKMFYRSVPGAKKQVLNLAFQVGTFLGHDYNQGFTSILKIILMCQAMNIAVNIDMFDSDTQAIRNDPSYVIVNIAKSHEKLNLKEILVASHAAFFHFSLFNGYSASGAQRHIGTFLSQERLTRDLGPMYDVIGGNILRHQDEMVSTILKIGLKNGRSN